MSTVKQEVIVVRSLTESDLGIFGAHRSSAKSKQRAININASIAKAILRPEDVAADGVDLECTCIYGEVSVQEPRGLRKVGKNWRLGGRKLEHSIFGELDSKDFVLIRLEVPSGASSHATLRFVSKKRDRVVHAGLVAMLGGRLDGSMLLVRSTDESFSALSGHCPLPGSRSRRLVQTSRSEGRKVEFPKMPKDPASLPTKPRKMEEKLRSPVLLEQMLKVAGDLSAPAQLQFMDTVGQLASQLREILLATGRIVTVTKDHGSFWPSVKSQRVGFVDGGLANLAMLGSAPIAARVGGYSVVPGERGDARESFTVLKYLIDELYASSSGGVYDSSFPDVGALRDAARISIEAAGAVQLLSEQQDLKWLFLHGALVNPVSRYTDVMRDGRSLHQFPSFSESAVGNLLSNSEYKTNERGRNFINVYLEQLKILVKSNAAICGVVERESSSASVFGAIIDSLTDDEIGDLLPVPVAQWKAWIKAVVSPDTSENFEGQRITDSLLFRCVLEPGEALSPVVIDRNETRRAPSQWIQEIRQYPKPHVSYILPSEWSPPVRVEVFEKDVGRFTEIAALILHCCHLLPRYAFPVGLDIVDKFAKIPGWISRPVNTAVVVQAMRMALDKNNSRLFDSLRRTLCGSGREFLLRPGIFR